MPIPPNQFNIQFGFFQGLQFSDNSTFASRIFALAA